MSVLFCSVLFLPFQSDFSHLLHNTLLSMLDGFGKPSWPWIGFLEFLADLAHSLRIETFFVFGQPSITLPLNCHKLNFKLTPVLPRPRYPRHVQVCSVSLHPILQGKKLSCQWTRLSSWSIWLCAGPEWRMMSRLSGCLLVRLGRIGMVSGSAVECGALGRVWY